MKKENDKCKKELVYALKEIKTGKVLIYATSKMALCLLIKKGIKTFKDDWKNYKIIAGIFEEIEIPFEDKTISKELKLAGVEI